MPSHPKGTFTFIHLQNPLFLKTVRKRPEKFLHSGEWPAISAEERTGRCAGARAMPLRVARSGVRG